MAKSLTIRNKQGEDLYPVSVSSLIYDRFSGESVEQTLDNKQDTLVSGTNIKTINNNSLLGSGNIDIPKGDKGDPLTYADLTATQKAEIAQPAAEQAAIAAGHLATIQAAIDNLDPSQSTDDAIATLAIQLADTQGDVDALGQEIDLRREAGTYKEIDLASLDILHVSVWADLTYSDAMDYCRSCMIPLSSVEKVKLTNNTSGNCVYVFLVDNSTTSVNVSSQNPSTRNVLNAGKSIEIDVAEDSKYLFVNYYNNGDRLSKVELLSSVVGSARLKAIENDIDFLKNNPLKCNPVLTQKDFNATYNIDNIEKVAWTWWFYPQMICQDAIHNHLWIGYTDEDGFAGIVNYNPSQKKGRKVALKWSNDSGFGYLADDHNNALAYMLDDGRMVCIYASGHEYDNNVYVRIADNKDNYKFSTIKTIEFGGKTTYIQVIKVGTKFFMICRCTNSSNYSWQYTISEDNMATWSSPSTLIVGTTARYYVKLREVKDNSNVIRMVAYGHPTQSSDNSVRMGFIDFSNNAIYNSDGTTQIGTLGTSLSYTAFNVIIPSVTNKSMRLLDVAITNKSDYAVVYGIWTSSVKTDGVYKVATSDGIKDVAVCGNPFWTPSVYLNGATFLNEGSIVLSRNDGTRDYIEIYTYSNDSWTLSKTIHSEVCGTTPIKNIRPIVDKGGNLIAWQRGKFVDTNHTGDFILDIKLYDVNQGIVLI